MTIKKILWPTDFSRVCQTVIPLLAQMRELHQAEVLVLYVASDLGDVKDWYGEPDPDHVRKFSEWETQRAHQLLDEVCSTDLGGPLKVSHKVAFGDPYVEIMKTIEEDQIDLVVISSRGRGSEKRATFDFGSIADRVVKNASVPVLVINPRKKGD